MVKKWWGRLLRGGHCDSVFWMEYYEPDMRVSFIVAIARATLFPVGCRGSGKGSKNSERGVSFLYVLNKCVNRAYGAGVAEGLCGIGVWLSIF